MATTESRPQTPAPDQRLLHYLVQNKKQVSYILLGAAGLLLIGCVLSIIRWGPTQTLQRWPYLWLGLWAGAMMLLCLGSALWQMTSQASEIPELDAMRLLVLTLGGCAGLFTTALGVAFGWIWWDQVIRWLKIGEGKEASESAYVLLVFGVFFIGLALMFVSLQLARTEERTNVNLRRLLYGYNTALMGLLLLVVLALVNILIFLNGPSDLDFTSSNIYSLSQRSKSILQNLEKPAKVIVLLQRNDAIYTEVQTLLANCRRENERFQIEEIPLTAERVSELAKKYPGLDQGLIVVYGTGGAAEEDFRIIKREDLYSMDFQPRGEPTDKQSFKFKGEDALMTELSFLAEGKRKPVIYFTQGNGEFDLNESNASRLDQGLGLLKGRLTNRLYDVKPLQFTPSDSKVPDDAAIVVIVRPLTPYPDFALKALRDYMNPTDPGKPGGKLMVLMDVIPARDNTMQRTGLEDFLAEFNVQVGNDRILSFQRNPQQVIVTVNQDLIDRNPIATAFREEAFILYSIRPVQPGMAPRPGGGGRYRAEILLYAPAGPGIWLEKNLQEDAVKLARDLLKNAEERDKKLSRGPISVAVGVTEAALPDPHDFGRPPAEGKPRLVVMGDASLAANYFMTSEAANHFDLLAASLDWLREKPGNIGIEPKKREFYKLDSKFDATRYWRTILIPLAFIGIGIVGLGAGVWVVRRQ